MNEALTGGAAKRDDVEARFAALERGTGARPGGVEVDDELAALKKKVRVQH